MQKNRQKSNKSKEKHAPKEPPTGQILRDDHYTVERIKNKRNKGAYCEYLVQWVGFPGEDTWERIENLEYVTALVEEYEERVKLERSNKKKKSHVFIARGRIAEVTEEKEASFDSSKGEQKETISKYCYTRKKEKDTEDRKPLESAPQLCRKQEQSIDKGSIDKSSIDKSSMDKSSIDKSSIDRSIDKSMDKLIDKPLPPGKRLKPVSIKFSGERLQPRPQPTLPIQPLKTLKPSSITFRSTHNPFPQTSIAPAFHFQ